MAFRRTTNLPCKISKKISLRLHPDVHDAILAEANRRTLEEGRLITKGDIIREILNKSKDFPRNTVVPQSSQMTRYCPSSGDYHQLLMTFA